VRVSELAGSIVASQFVMIVNAVSLIRRTGFGPATQENKVDVNTIRA